MTLLQHIKKFYEWKHIRILLIVNTVITVFVWFLNVREVTNFKEFINLLLYLLILVQSIGFSIFTVLKLFPLDNIGFKSLKWFIIILSIVIAGWIGMFIGTILSDFLTNIQVYLTFSRNEIFMFSGQFLVFGLLAFGYFMLREKLRETAARLAEKEIREQRLLQQKTQAELDALRAKINPHFLFNTLNSIASLIPDDPKGAEDMVQKLSFLFRNTLDVNHRTMISLTDEFDTVKKYLEIERIRLGKRLTYRIEIDESLKKVPIPALLLQPLVENAIRHGIAPKKEGGEIVIQAQKEKDRCRIQISDTGVGFPEDKSFKGFGLRSVCERLDICYSDDYQFTISNQDGTQIIISIPIQIEDSGHDAI